MRGVPPLGVRQGHPGGGVPSKPPPPAYASVSYQVTLEDRDVRVTPGAVLPQALGGDSAAAARPVGLARTLAEVF